MKRSMFLIAMRRTNSSDSSSVPGRGLSKPSPLRAWFDLPTREAALELKLARPLLPAVKDRDEFESVTPNAVRDDERSVWNHQFSSPEHPPWPAHVGLRLKKIDGSKNPLRDECSVLFRILCDKSS